MPAPPPKSRDRSGAWAWIVVAVLGVAAIAAVVAKVGRTPPAPPRPQPSASTSASASAAPSASVSEAPIGLERVTDMVRVPATTFTMGSSKDDAASKPAHEVVMTHAFYIDRTEVTAEAYQRCVDEGTCASNKVHGEGVQETTYGCNGKEKPLHPANCVDREQASKFCKFSGKRLPTEAEWELAARGTDARDYPWGNAAPTSCAQAILTGMTGDCGDRKGTWDVGTTAEGKSPYGAFDMAGNVWEWVADGFAEYPSAAVIDPRVAPSPKGVLRGGSWDYATTSAKTTYRLAFPAATGNVSIGFRCARDD
jgi:formylglycine-generating enzyme required for sulfatase activity